VWADSFMEPIMKCCKRLGNAICQVCHELLESAVCFTSEAIRRFLTRMRHICSGTFRFCVMMWDFARRCYQKLRRESLSWSNG
jgi:hypothetical protein